MVMVKIEQEGKGNRALNRNVESKGEDNCTASVD